ncbi:MAG: response regulator [Balneolia bacterium]|nr:response regulator [Balneolia bacterium]
MKGNLNILIVDDCEVMQSIIKKSLSMIGLSSYQVDTAGNGIEGLKQAGNKIYDLIFMDLNMPVMGGFEMIDYLREDVNSSETQIIVVSSDAQEETLKLVSSMGFEFLQKPFKPEALRDKLVYVMTKVSNA